MEQQQRRRAGTARILLVAGFAATLATASCARATTEQAPARSTGLPLTLDNVFRQGRGGAASPRISPDGRWIVYSAGRGPLQRIGVSGAEPAAEWVEGSAATWAPDSQSIAFVRDERLWRAPLAGGEPTALTPAPLKGMRAPVFSPDGGSIAFMSLASGHQDVWVVSSSGGEPRQLTQQAMSADDGRFTPSWSPDGTRIAYVSNKADYWSDDVWVVDVASGSASQVSRGITAIGPLVQWSPSGDRLAVFGTAKKDYWYLDIADIFLVDPAAGRETKLSMPLHVTAYGHRAFWSADGSRIFFVYQERGEHHLWSVASAGGVPTRVSHLGGVISGLDAAGGADAFVFARSSEEEGNDLYYLPAAGGPERRLTRLAVQWEGLQAPTEVSFPSFDGLYIQGFLYLPPGAQQGQQCPALVQVHGGGTNSYMKGPNLVEQYLASRGFVVLAINYRGGSGFGREFQDLAVNDWLNGQAFDPGAAADYLRTLPFTNRKVGIYGGSYGGMQSMAAITRTPDKFDAAAPMRGVYSQSMTFDHMDRLGKIFAKTGHGGLPAERPEIYSKSSTIERLSAIRVPVLLTHGELDDRAPYRNYELALAELKRLNKQVEAKSYAGEGHGFRNPDNSIDMYTMLEQFFTKHLGSCAAVGR